MANELIPILDLALQPFPAIAIVIAATILLFTVVWGIHVKIEDAGIVDFVWGGSFALTAWLGMALLGSATATALLLALLVTLWAVRLTVHMVSRHRKMEGEDARYAAMRRRGGPSFWWRSLFMVFLVQAVVQILVASPIYAALLIRAESVSVLAVTIGFVLFTAGFLVEAIADHQLWRFKAEPANRGKLMTGGLFAWSRHPNYFGEIVLWSGLGLIGYGASGSLLALVGPALLTLLLIKVSGVDLLDAHLRDTKPGFAEWAARTNALLPWPPRRRAAAAQSAGPLK